MLKAVEAHQFHTLRTESEVDAQIQHRKKLLSELQKNGAPDSYLNSINDDVGKLEILKIERKYPSAKSETLKTLAIYLHKEFCHQDHTADCSWDYEHKGDVHDWTRHAHKRYLEIAVRNYPHLKNILEG